MTLAELADEIPAVVARLDLDEVDGAVLRAMGVAEGDAIVVLRRAPFGGPLHVRVGEASFALDRGVAESIIVRKAEPD